MLPSNWPTLLNQAIEERRESVFAWGVHDCCMMASDIIRAFSGVDPAAGFRGRYSDEAGARALIAEYGSLEQLVDSVTGLRGWAHVDVRSSRRGDLVFYPNYFSGDPALGVCIGVNSIFPDLKGIAARPTLDCKRAWRVC